MSRGSWNTGADGCAGCEDMPRKPLDIRFTENPASRVEAILWLPP